MEAQHPHCLSRTCHLPGMQHQPGHNGFRNLDVSSLAQLKTRRSPYYQIQTPRRRRARVLLTQPKTLEECTPSERRQPEDPNPTQAARACITHSAELYEESESTQSEPGQNVESPQLFSKTQPLIQKLTSNPPAGGVGAVHAGAEGAGGGAGGPGAVPLWQPRPCGRPLPRRQVRPFSPCTNCLCSACRVPLLSLHELLVLRPCRACSALCAMQSAIRPTQSLSCGECTLAAPRWLN